MLLTKRFKQCAKLLILYYIKVKKIIFFIAPFQIFECYKKSSLCQQQKCPNQKLMDKTRVKKCLMGLKIKNCEGYDRIPLIILNDIVETLYKPMT